MKCWDKFSFGQTKLHGFGSINERYVNHKSVITLTGPSGVILVSLEGWNPAIAKAFADGALTLGSQRDCHERLFRYYCRKVEEREREVERSAASKEKLAREFQLSNSDRRFVKGLKISTAGLEDEAPLEPEGSQ